MRIICLSTIIIMNRCDAHQLNGNGWNKRERVTIVLRTERKQVVPPRSFIVLCAVQCINVLFSGDDLRERFFFICVFVEATQMEMIRKIKRIALVSLWIIIIIAFEPRWFNIQQTKKNNNTLIPWNRSDRKSLWKSSQHLRFYGNRKKLHQPNMGPAMAYAIWTMEQESINELVGNEGSMNPKCVVLINSKKKRLCHYRVKFDLTIKHFEFRIHLN